MSLSDLQIGGWNVLGATVRSAMFASGNIACVDGNSGSASNPGSGPGSGEAVALPTTALTKVIRGGVVYIKPRMTVAAAQTYYDDNITIPLTLSGLKMLGCGSDEDNPYMGVDIKAATAGVGLPVVSVLAAGVTIEGIRFAGTGQTADTASIMDVQNNGTTTRAYGLKVRGCRFANSKGHLISAGAAISIDTAIMVKIEKCTFTDNLAGITVRSNYAAINGLKITDCDFEGSTLANIDSYIYIVGDGTGLVIQKCNFNMGLPNHGVINRFLFLQLVDGGIMADCKFAVTGANCTGMFGVGGSKAEIPATVFMTNNWMESSTAGIGMITRT